MVRLGPDSKLISGGTEVKSRIVIVWPVDYLELTPHNPYLIRVNNLPKNKTHNILVG